jgi:hypothetical protein
VERESGEQSSLGQCKAMKENAMGLEEPRLTISIAAGALVIGATVITVGLLALNLFNF